MKSGKSTQRDRLYEIVEKLGKTVWEKFFDYITY